jgi:hypothetical protein
MMRHVRTLVVLSALWWGIAASAAALEHGSGLWTEAPDEALNFDVARSGLCEALPGLALDFRLWPEGPEPDLAMPQGCLESFTGEVPEDWHPR